MKCLVVYSSRTGNTKKVAEAIAAELTSGELYPVESAPDITGFDLVIAGYWVDRGMPDAAARAWLETVHDASVALFGTLGAWPDSDHAKSCMAAAETLLTTPERHNTVLGSWLCQGKIDPHVLEMMRKVAADAHPMTPERIARIKEAEKHPDAADLARARAFFAAIARRIEKQ